MGVGDWRLNRTSHLSPTGKAPPACMPMLICAEGQAVSEDILIDACAPPFGYQTTETADSQGIRMSPGLSCWEKKRAQSLVSAQGEDSLQEIPCNYRCGQNLEGTH